MAYLKYLTDHMEPITFHKNEKIYLEQGELKLIKKPHYEIFTTQSQNWALIDVQLKAMSKTEHHMKNCIQNHLWEQKFPLTVICPEKNSEIVSQYY